MNKGPGIPPALAKEIQAALAAGRPLPSGVIAVPEGQRPPPGAIPAGMSAQLPPGMQPQMPPPSKAQHNPIPDGDEGLKILRGFANCPIPQESTKLNRMLQMILQNQSTDDDSADEVLAKGLTAAMKANRYCSQNRKTRTVCIFSEDEKLQDLHLKIKEETANLEALNKEMEECVKRGNTLLMDRWKKAVDTYGLSPEKYLYHIDEEKGIIEQVDLNCDTCKGVVVIRHARQEVTEKLMKSQPTPIPVPVVPVEAPAEAPVEAPAAVPAEAPAETPKEEPKDGNAN
jgi:hypothetical protein